MALLTLCPHCLSPHLNLTSFMPDPHILTPTTCLSSQANTLCTCPNLKNLKLCDSLLWTQPGVPCFFLPSAAPPFPLSLKLIITPAFCRGIFTPLAFCKSRDLNPSPVSCLRFCALPQSHGLRYTSGADLPYQTHCIPDMWGVRNLEESFGVWLGRKPEFYRMFLELLLILHFQESC